MRRKLGPVPHAKRSLVLLFMVLALVSAACGRDSGSDTDTATGADDGAQQDESENVVEQIALAAPEETNDYGWNQQGREGAEAAAEAVGAELEVADGLGYDDVAPVLSQLADGGADLIIAHASGYNTVGAEAAQQSSIPTLIFDNPDATVPGVSANVKQQPQEGGYLAGVMAAHMTQTDTLGIVISADATSWNRQAGGFVEGARSVNPEVGIRLSQIGEAGFADVAGGRRVTENLIGAGADIILGMGDGSSFGMIQAVETTDPPQGADQVWFIDVIGDKTSLDERGIYLSSITWNFDGTFQQAVEDINAGTFGETEYLVTVENGGIELLRTEHIPEDVWAEVEAAQQAIATGEVDVPELETKADVEQLIQQD
jgi:basic membrane protein A